MKNISIYIILVFALCFGLKAQAQQPVIMEYSAKLAGLSELQAQLLDGLINGASSMVFIDSEGSPDIYQRGDEQVKKIMLRRPSEFDSIVKTYGDQLAGVQVINIEWNGTDVFTFPTNTMSTLPNLEYVHIRSYQNLSPQTITRGFQGLVVLMENSEDIEVLYSITEEAQ